MNTVITPTRERWMLHNGAIFCGPQQIGSCVLAMNQGVPRLLVTCNIDEERYAYVDLQQNGLVDLIFQLVAGMTGEWYLIDTTHMVKTNVDHVWFDNHNGWYYFMDETAQANGPFPSKIVASDRCNQYCMRNLQDGTQEYTVTYDTTEDFDPEFSSFKHVKAYGRDHTEASESFHLLYPGNRILSIDIVEQPDSSMGTGTLDDSDRSPTGTGFCQG